jgi:uncharacterized protein (TIGR01319 family)
MPRALLIDFGSTFTKARAVDLADGRLLAKAQAPSTVTTNVMDGLGAALESIFRQLPDRPREDYLRLATSSAAGGLRIVAIGLIESMTAEAARRAALGAGGKVVAAFAGTLSGRELRAVQDTEPDMIVLSGGTNGGDARCLLSNAELLAASRVSCPVVVAGNEKVGDEAAALLEAAGKVAVLVANVMPQVDRLDIAECSEAIRTVFMERIVESKGLREAESFVGEVVMPTPRAVLRACELICQGPEENGLGELVCVDVGGATTDVYSVASGAASGNVVSRGLPEPFAKRTVEGDLGLRINAPSIIDAVGTLSPEAVVGEPFDPVEAAWQLATRTETLPRSEAQWRFDASLGRAAATVAMRRHAGTIEEGFGPEGRFFVQRGKDLSLVSITIGTGGIFSASSPDTVRWILEGTTADPREPDHLLPRSSTLMVDRDYVLFAVGLLADVAPQAAFQLALGSLVNISADLAGGRTPAGAPGYAPEADRRARTATNSEIAS